MHHLSIFAVLSKNIFGEKKNTFIIHCSGSHPHITLHSPQTSFRFSLLKGKKQTACQLQLLSSLYTFLVAALMNFANNAEKSEQKKAKKTSQQQVECVLHQTVLGSPFSIQNLINQLIFFFSWWRNKLCSTLSLALFIQFAISFSLIPCDSPLNLVAVCVRACVWVPWCTARARKPFLHYFFATSKWITE